MSEIQSCPICTMTDLAEAPEHYECITCGHEWPREVELAAREVRDCNGNLLVDGDSVTLVKDLKVNGTMSNKMKVGTKVNGIRIVDGDHEIDGKVGGRGMLIKAEFVKKV